MQSGVVLEKKSLQKRKGISGSTLKIIAIITMLIDHIGAVVLARFLIAASYQEVPISKEYDFMNILVQERDTIYAWYLAMRLIGRIAFPIFCFLLVEGFQKTRNIKKYVLRLGIFALVSEIPFDLACSSKILEFSYQNVYFTLFFGLCAMIFCQTVEKKQWNGSQKMQKFYGYFLQGIIILAFCCIAQALKTDYGASGVLCMMLLYYFRNQKSTQIAVGAIAFSWEFTAPLAFVPIAFYNGKRGLSLKYFFYLFYPLHLLLLYLFCVCFGIAQYPAF